MITFTRLKRLSLTHSAIYTGLLVAWIAPGLGGPTLVLGWAHGVLWIAMSLMCLTAVRRRIIPLRIGVAVAVIGGIGPFVGSYEFIREQRLTARQISPVGSVEDAAREPQGGAGSAATRAR